MVDKLAGQGWNRGWLICLRLATADTEVEKPQGQPLSIGKGLTSYQPDWSLWWKWAGVCEFVLMSRISITVAAVFVTTTCALAQVQLQPRMGDAFPGLTADQQIRFDLGRVAYMRNITVEEGLGPDLQSDVLRLVP